MELLASLIGGPVLGALGSFVSNAVGAFIDLKKQAQQNAHEIRLHELNLQARQAEQEHEAAIAEWQGRAEMMQASYAHDAGAGPTYKWVAAILRLVRPVLTFTLMALTAWFFNEGAIGQEEMVRQVVFFLGVAITWWFGDRRMNRSGG